MRSRRNVYADEGGRHIQRATQTKIQRADIHRKAIINYGIFQCPNDTETLIEYLETFLQKYTKQSREIVADAGYGSQQNYEYMFDKGMIPYAKYNYFHKE